MSKSYPVWTVDELRNKTIDELKAIKKRCKEDIKEINERNGTIIMEIINLQEEIRYRSFIK